MRSSIISILFTAIFLSEHIKCAKILAIFPFSGQSQYLAIEPYLKTLARRGHDLTVLSQFPQKTRVPNYTDITLIYEEEYDELLADSLKFDAQGIMNLFMDFARNMTLLVLENPTVQQLISSKSINFDLVIIDTANNEALYAFGPHFNAHTIGFSSFGTDGQLDLLVGNTSPISYVPHILSNFTDNMNFWERLQNLLIEIRFWYNCEFHMVPLQRQIYRKYFPHLKQNFDDVRRNFSLMLINNHYSISYPRPYVPNMIDVGGLFINDKPAPLPNDLAEFIDNAKDGAILISFGSHIKSKLLPPDKLKIFLKTFANLKQRVLFKYELPELRDKPANVYISKWFPQSVILAHPNVKLFVTHGGLLSTTEAIYYAKPIIAIPFFFDQFLNAARAQISGFGVTLQFRGLAEKRLREAILHVLENDSFKLNVEKRSRIFHDRPMKPLDTAIYWTEYVLRHNGARHLRVGAQRLSLLQYHSIDTLGCLLGVLFMGGGAVFWITNIVIKSFLIKGKARKKNKKE